MSDTKELRQSLQQVAELVHQIEEIADPHARSAAKLLVQTLMDLHGAALERMLEKVFESGETGQNIIDGLGTDPLISSLLVLYGLHPEDVETRVARAFHKVAGELRTHHAEPELLSVQEGAVRIKVTIGEHSCGSTAKTARSLLEDALYEAAPDMKSLTIEGLDGKSASGFVALDKLMPGLSSSAIHSRMASNPETKELSTLGD
jgi:hypothetical protein